MFCKYCGATLDDDSLFCAECGRRLGTVANLKSEKPVQAKETEPIEIKEKKQEQKSEKWLYYDCDVAYSCGPLSYEEMADKIRNGEVNFNGMVKKENDRDWVLLNKSVFVPVLNEWSKGAGIKERKVSISDRWVWCLAILPTLVSIALRQLGVLTPGAPFDWAICVGLNALFFFLDRQEIEKVGITESWTYLGILIVPLYLVFREIKTNNNYAPAVANVFMLVCELLIF